VWSPPTDAASSVYKIPIAEEGIYRLDASFFANNGIDTASIDLNSVRLYHLGQEVAIDVYDQDNDGIFDAVDYIQFYGQLPAAGYAKYAKENIYWLVTAGGSGSPKRMLTVDGSPAAGALATSHSFSVQRQDDEYYVGLAPGADSRDRWYFDDFVLGTDFTGGPDPVQVPFSLTLPGVVGSGSLKISLWGYYDTDHEVEVWVNDVDLNLTAATTVKLACNYAPDGLIVDYLEASYPKSFSADSDSLTFSHVSGYRYIVDGFSIDALSIFDISDAAAVARITDGQISGTGPFSIEFEPPPSGTIVEDHSANLADSDTQADYILITHKDIGWDGSGAAYTWLTDLVALREEYL
jgi:hypothetical protein